MTGNLEVKTIAVSQEAQLWVAKDITATDYILAGVSDAGGLAVKGTASAKAPIVTDSAAIAFGQMPESSMKVIERSEGTLDEDDFESITAADEALVSSDVDHKALVEAAKKGERILR